jgi:hypothetical protein
MENGPACGGEKVKEEHTPDQVAFRVHRLGCLPEVACRLMKEEIRDGRIACVSEHAQRLSRRREKLPHWRLVRPRKVTPSRSSYVKDATERGSSGPVGPVAIQW